MIKGLAYGLALVIWAGGASGAGACTVDPANTTAYPGSVTVDSDTRGAIAQAWFDAPVTRYRHFVLGRTHEPETLHVNAIGNQGLCGHALTLDADHVFEDVAPRLADLDGDGTNEVIVARSHHRLGAQLAVYRWTGTDLTLAATTPYIGRSNRWLAIIGAADLDDDGAMEIAYIDRPHLARTLRIWRYEDGGLTEIAAANGLTNHRIGEGYISSGIRDCGEGPEFLTADTGWSRLISTRLSDGALIARDLGPWSQGALSQALDCL
ncbi:FG-GAP repeat domain-containing protein [Nioella aestuarii]|uniref:FG-GAP repeat domain-containing protein n=1 Tax=Nioella aestuarii TaxID=1662864 RepID=UPI003D7FA6BE